MTPTSFLPDSTPRSLSAEEVLQVAGGPQVKNNDELVADLAPAPRVLSAGEVTAVAGGPQVRNDNE